MYLTSTGVALEFCGIAMLLDKLLATHPAPTPPTYAVQTAGGITELHEHDETTLQTDEDKAAWAQYLKDKAAAEKDYEQALTKLVLMRGVKAEMPEGWEAAQEFVGIKVPTDPLEKRWHWLTTEAMGTLDDYKAVVLGVMEASGVPEGVIAQMASSFRRKVEGAQATGLAPAKDKRVDVQRKVRANPRSRKNGTDPKPVRRTHARG